MSAALERSVGRYLRLVERIGSTYVPSELADLPEPLPGESLVERPTVPREEIVAGIER